MWLNFSGSSSVLVAVPFATGNRVFVLFQTTGELFAQAPVTEFPGIAVETVSDSSRYFVLRIQDDSGE